METAQTLLSEKLSELKFRNNRLSKKKIADLEKMTLDVFQEAARRTKAFVRSNPALTVAGIVVAGLVAAKIIGNRK